MPSYKDLERRVIEQNTRTCEDCMRDTCEHCTDLLDANDLWDTLGDLEYDRERDEGMLHNE